MAIRLLPFRQYAEQDVVNLYAVTANDITSDVTSTGTSDNGLFVKVDNGNLNDGPVKYDSTFTSYLGVDASSLPYVGRNQYPRVPLTVTCAKDGDQALGVTLYQTAETDENGQKLLYYPQKKLEVQAVLPGEAVPILSRGIIAIPCSTGKTLDTSTPLLDPEGRMHGINSAACLDLSNAWFNAAGEPQIDVVGSGIKLRSDGDLAPAQGQLMLANAQASSVVILSGGASAIPGGSEWTVNGGVTGGNGVFGHVLATGSRITPASGTADQFAGPPASATNSVATEGQGTGFYAIVTFDTNRLGDTSNV
jgi:hypothetical protein